MKKYLKQAPTLVVIGVTAFAVWSVLSPEGTTETPPGTSKPPVPENSSDQVESDSKRSPFQIEQPPESVAANSTAPGSTPGEPASKSNVLPDLLADEDGPLTGMRLSGIFIAGPEQLAVIDEKIYARGEQLKAADGSLMPYTVEEIRKDRAILRRGRRNFVLAFSDVPRTAGPKAETVAKAGKAGDKPKGETVAKAEKVAKARPNPSVGPNDSKKTAATDSGLNPNDPSGSKATILKILTGVAGTAAGASGMGNTVNEQSLSAGLDALMGKRDGLGQDGGIVP